MRAVAGLARPLVAFAAVLCCSVLCCAVAAVAVHGGCRLRRPIARRLPTTAAAANAAVLGWEWDAVVRLVPHCFCC